MPEVRLRARRIGVVALVAMVFAVGGGVIGFGTGRPASTALIVLGVAVLGFGVAAIVMLLRRRFVGGPLATESPATRRAVGRAIRDGHADDPRIEDLARAVAARAPNPRPAYVGLSVMCVLQLAVVLIDVVGGGHRVDWVKVAVLVYMSLMAALVRWQHRRLDRFR